MRYRYLRITWTVFCGIACVLLLVLWVRSYFRNDSSYVSSRYLLLEIESHSGEIICWWHELDYQPNFYFPDEPSTHSLWGFGIHRQAGLTANSLPYWFPVLLAAAFAAIPWLPWSRRFSLRTLLIATTLLCVGLGLIVWLSR